MSIKLLFFLLTLNFSNNLYAQNDIEIFPKITGYVGILHPIVTFSSEETKTNFTDYYIVGLPIGINIWKNPTIGLSFEIVPSIKSDSKISKVNNVLIHPGILVRLKKNYTFAGRIAFETSGRYGITPVLTKVIKKNKDHNYFVSLPMPVRFGNNHPTSLTFGFQFGIAF
ncbi:hypothetical protein DB895_09360 [Flavobacterium psychrotolerans]|uniref:Outer membrane protein beta-barrel domain-containing protein n=1 Tax=Flavobacterium psychrotolerans TaxID=2169410 RepID=A0A2U1JIK3_9FLAO|nr:hypothetical protein DB895_09360 [Flavobacterium psychrotolerans]